MSRQPSRGPAPDAMGPHVCDMATLWCPQGYQWVESSRRVIANQAAVPLVYVPLEAVASKWYGAYGLLR